MLNIVVMKLAAPKIEDAPANATADSAVVAATATLATAKTAETAACS